jgi:hypothetical protein
MNILKAAFARLKRDTDLTQESLPLIPLEGPGSLCIFSRPFMALAQPEFLFAEDLSAIEQRDGIAYINPALLRGSDSRRKLDPDLKDLVDSVL